MQATATTECRKCRHPKASYTPPRPGSRDISINNQPEDTKTLLRYAIHEAVGDAIFTNAFPPPLPSSTYTLVTTTKCAYTLGLNYLAHRVKHDKTFCSYVARLVCHLSLFSFYIMGMHRTEINNTTTASWACLQCPMWNQEGCLSQD